MIIDWDLTEPVLEPLRSLGQPSALPSWAIIELALPFMTLLLK